MNLKNKNAIITGANQGLGLEIARKFVQEGANVMVCARDEKRLREALDSLKSLATSNNKVLGMTVNIADHEQVEEMVKSAINALGTVDILVANAGVYGTKGPIDEIDLDEWSEAIDINLKGSVFTCRAVLPEMKKNRRGKIVIISGGGATKPMPYLSAYAASKAGLVRFAETLAEELKEFNIDVNSVAPGGLNTRMLDEVLAAGPEKVGKSFYEQSLKQQASGGTPLSVGAELCSFLASTQSDGITGKLISALWDPWKQLPEYIEDIKNSDIYTIRRITPKDRGKTWDPNA